MNGIKVELIRYTKDADLLAAAAAKGCFAQESSAEIEAQLRELNKEEREKEIRKILSHSIGRGHGSVGDLAQFTFSIAGVPRLATFQLCLLEYLQHLQQSMRRVLAKKGYYLSNSIRDSECLSETQEVLDYCFSLYNEMVQAGIPEEDARYLLPLCARTNITTGGNVRELTHLNFMTHLDHVPKVVKDVIDKMLLLSVDVAPELFSQCQRGYNPINYRPSAQLYSSKNQTIEMLMKHLGDQNHYGTFSQENVTFLDSSTPSYFEKDAPEGIGGKESNMANLKHVHFSFLKFSSLVNLHQIIRQRTWNLSVESIYDAVNNAQDVFNQRVTIPDSVVRSKFTAKFSGQAVKMLRLYNKLIKKGIPKSDAIDVIPHALKIFSLVHIDGWNAIGAIGQRTCETAQWEVRDISTRIAEYISQRMPGLGKYARPKCFRLKSCPEGNKKCSNFGNWS